MTHDFVPHLAADETHDCSPQIDGTHEFGHKIVANRKHELGPNLITKEIDVFDPHKLHVIFSSCEIFFMFFSKR